MPPKPKRLCVRCGQVVQGSCTKCQKQRQRASNQARHSDYASTQYRSKRWTEYSKEYRRQYPLCADCAAKGITKGCDVVGHIKPANQYPELFWEPSNHRPLCFGCNKRQEISDRGLRKA